MKGYTLVVCEKPDAARRVSESLSGGTAVSASVNGVSVFRFRFGKENLVVCAAQGHLYTISDPFVERSVYPVFDAEWYGNDLVEKEAAGAARRIAVIRDLAKGAGRFVNACDYDAEGETIGFNILRYACGRKEVGVLRAKFSTLTHDDLVRAFGAMEEQRDMSIAEAGRARHIIDFAWGVNLSRVLSQSALVWGSTYRTVSVGRVQGPTLRFVVEREHEIRAFVPRPYWSLTGIFETGETKIGAAYLKERLNRKADAEKIQSECVGGTGVVGRLRKTSAQIPPPPPFNVGDLQKEAYRAFGYSPSRTLQIAERLYLKALISYPRTGSQKLASSIGYRKILRGLASVDEYSRLVATLITGGLNSVLGTKDDPAHPAIHPTGEKPKSLDGSEARLYDLVVRRFLSVFAPPARRETVSAEISVNGHLFGLERGKTVEPGWLSYYAPYGSMVDAKVPPIRDGDRLVVVEIKSEEKFEVPPRRYNQSSLLEKMESEEIGTKATRADIIATLVTRGYMSGEYLTVSDLGFSIIEIMKRHAPTVVSTELTRTVEEGLEVVDGGKGHAKELVREAVRAVSDQLAELELNEEEVGREISSAATAESTAKRTLGLCPVCKTGKLQVVKSRKSGKRFVGCTNYSVGCRASAPLPQRGALKGVFKPCRHCSWPVVYMTVGKFPWKLCVNPDCPSKRVNRREVRTV